MIWAEDKTGPATDSAARNIQGLVREIDSVRTVLASLGGMFGIAAFASAVQGALNAADEINKLAQKTGLSVEAFQQLKYAAGLAGVDAKALSIGIKGLSTMMVEASDASSQAARVLRALGVDVRGGVNEAILRLADAFSSLPDGQLKVAAATRVFGKAGQDLIPFLNQGSDAIRKLADEATRLGIVMSAEATRAAEEYNDNLTRIKATTERLAVAVVNDLSPSLVRVTAAMRQAAEDSGILMAVWVGLGSVIPEALGINNTELQDLQANLKRAQKEVAELGVHIDAPRRKDLLAGVAAAGNMIEGAFLKANFQLGLTRTTLDAIAGKFDDQVSRRARQGQALPVSPGASARRALEEALAGTLAGAGAGSKNEVSAFATAFENLRAKIEGAALGLDSSFLKSVGLLNIALAAGKIDLQDHARLFALLVRQQPFFKKGLEEEAKVHESVTKAIEDGIAERRRQLDAIRDEIGLQAEANDTYGMSKAQIEGLKVARLEEQLAILRQSGALEDELEGLSEEIKLRQRLLAQYGRGERLDMLRREQELEAQVWDEGSSRGANFFVDLAVNGTKTFRTLRDEASRFGQELLAIFGKKLILQIGAALTGSASLAAMAGQVGQGTLAGAAGNWLGSTALGSAVSGAGSSFLGGWNAVTGAGEAGVSAIGANGFAGTIGETMASGYQWLLSNPYTAAAAIAVIAAIAISRMRGGGPKEGGSFFGGYDATGAYTGSLAVPGSDNGRFYTPSGGDSTARQWGDTAAGAFFDVLRSLGGSSTGIQFGFGYDKDPRGTADSRVTALVRGADGRVLYSNTQTAGRDDEDFDRAVGLQTRRAILAGLQGSELPEAIANILSSVAADTASTEQIDQVFALAGAMKALLDTLTPLSVEDLVAEAGRSAIASWRAQGAQLRELANSTDLSVESLGRLAQATGQYRAAAAQLILQFEAARTSVAAGIGDTLRDFRFQTLDKQGQYNMLRGEASGYAGSLGTMEDAGQILDTVNRIRQLSSQAFGMLSDEDKRAMLAEYEAGLKEVQRIADERLVVLREDVKAEANAQLAREEKIANDMAAAADRMEKAATTFDAAANRLAGATINANVSVNVQDGTYEVQPA
ncbi:MAG: hypothetical protein AB7P08_10365 [Burkholderiales bacterium]